MPPQLEPTDVEIRLFAREGSAYPVEITLQGERVFRGKLAADLLPWVPTGDTTEDGRRLFRALFADAVLREAWAEARASGKPLRLRLRIDTDAAELHALPWEMLDDGAGMLAARADIAFSRYLPIRLPWGGAVEHAPIRMLVAIANPDDLESRYHLPPVPVKKELAAIREALEPIPPGKLELIVMSPPITLPRLEAEMRKREIHILHFVGHGAFDTRRGQAALYFQDESGKARRVLDAELAGMLVRQGVRPRLVFLTSCQSAARSTHDAFAGLAPKLVEVGVPAVVAMQDLFSMGSSRTFTRHFYRALVEDGRVDVAVSAARNALLTEGRPDAAVPVLFMRLRSGRLWGSEADARGLILGEGQPRIFWSGLVRMLRRGRVLPILGPRLHGRWLPRRDLIARRWAEEHGYPFSDHDNLARVAQYMASIYGLDFPRQELLDELRKSFLRRLPASMRPDPPPRQLSELIAAVGWKALGGSAPNDVHRVLAELPLPLYLTTNYDNLMTEALRAAGRNPTREICRWHPYVDEAPSRFDEEADYRPTVEEPLVYHLYGNDEWPDAIVLTEDQYFDFLVRLSSEMDRLPHYIRGAFANTSLVLLGYGLWDWEFRVLLHGLIAPLDQRHRFKHVAVQLEVDHLERPNKQEVQQFLAQYFQDAKINIYWGTAEQFTAELREVWEVEER